MEWFDTYFRLKIKFLLRKGKDLTDRDKKKIASAREKLRSELDEWRSIQLAVFPALVDEFHDKVTSSVFPPNSEDEPLLLPSSFSELFRQSYLGMSSAANAEMEIRKGRAHERLEEIRLSIQTYNHHIGLKAKEIRSQNHITRERNLQNGLLTDIRKPAYHYNKTYEALLSLGLPPDDSVLRPLQDNELWAKNTALPSHPGDSRLEDPWFWHVAAPSKSSPAEKNVIQQESRVSCLHSPLWSLTCF